MVNHRYFDTSTLTIEPMPFEVPTKRGVLLKGALFKGISTVEMAKIGRPNVLFICLTGIHGNFETNPMYYYIGDLLGQHGFDFCYGQTCDAYNKMETMNIRIGAVEMIGSFNEDFHQMDEDIDAYLA